MKNRKWRELLERYSFGLKERGRGINAEETI
jgi:hypothetical protein